MENFWGIIEMLSTCVISSVGQLQHFALFLTFVTRDATAFRPLCCEVLLRLLRLIQSVVDCDFQLGLLLSAVATTVLYCFSVVAKFVFGVFFLVRP